MDFKMDLGGAYGGAKTGGSFDLMTFVQRPQVICRALCWLFCIVVFGCISSQGWRFEDGRDICIYNGNAQACRYATIVGVFGFLSTMAFIAGEYLFDNMSSVKSRKHYVLIDLAFSACWSFLYLVAFLVLWNEWSDTPEIPDGYGESNAKSAILFSFFNIIAWGLCALMAYRRYKIGSDAQFDSTYESDPTATQYTNYPIGNETDQYSQAPFSAVQEEPNSEYQAPTY